MRRSLAALSLAAVAAGCRLGGHGDDALRDARVDPLQLAARHAAPAREELDAAAARLERRHRAPVGVIAEFAITLADERLLLVAYAYESFEAWRAYRGLETWEREAAEWSADAEYDVWMSGLEASGSIGVAQRTADELFALCSPGEPRCDEGSVWADALEQARYEGCGGDRQALASFSLRPGAAPELSAAVVLGGRRCSPEALLFPADLDGDGAVELVAEARWSDEDTAAAHLELLVEDPGLAPLLSRRLFDRDAGSSGPWPDARYWAEDTDGDGRGELVIERFLLPGPCAAEPCRRLSYPSTNRLDLALPPPCFPLEPELARSGCRADQVERTVLSFDRERRLWL
jgi:hypothetical protein